MTPADARPTGAGLPPDPAGALTLARSTGRTVRDGSWWTAAVTVDSELLGGLVLHRDDELSEADQRILERAALVTALLLLIRRTAGEAESRVRGELLDELLSAAGPRPGRRCGSGPAGSASTWTRRTPSWWPGSEERCRPRALAAATPPGGDPRRAGRHARRLRRALPARRRARRGGGDGAPRS